MFPTLIFPENLADIASHKQHYVSLSGSCFTLNMWWRMISFDDVHDKLLVLNETLMKVCTVKQTPTSFAKMFCLESSKQSTE